MNAAQPARSQPDMARWLGLLYLAAGSLGLLNAIVPGYPGFNIPGLLGLSAWALLWAGILGRRGKHLPLWAFHGIVAQGTVLVCLAIHFTMGVPNAGSLFYLWIALYVFYFFPRLAASGHLALIGVSYAVAIALRPPPFPPGAHWLTTVGTLAIAGFLVGALKARLDTKISELRAAVRERDRALTRLQGLALSDPLTGLPNRRAWQERFVEEIVRAARTESSLSVAMLDLDDFKSLNDAKGHQAGDRLLLRLAGAWQEGVRVSDFVARLGGDEFGVLMPDCDAEGARSVLTRMRSATADVSVSVGLVVWDGEEATADLLKRADAALYEAKARGRNQVHVAG